jgi:hypothetical protein
VVDSIELINSKKHKGDFKMNTKDFQKGLQALLSQGLTQDQINNALMTDLVKKVEAISETKKEAKK